MQLIVFIRADSADGLCYQLTKPCPKEPEVIPFKDLEINRSEIQMQKKLGAGQFGEVWAGLLLVLVNISEMYLQISYYITSPSRLIY